MVRLKAQDLFENQTPGGRAFKPFKLTCTKTNCLSLTIHIGQWNTRVQGEARETHLSIYSTQTPKNYKFRALKTSGPYFKF